jgi:hypothetical protein
MLVCICKNELVEIWRINIIVLGFIFFFIGIQGLMKNTEENFENYGNVKILSIMLILFSTLFISIGLIKFENKKDENSILLNDEIN